MGTTGDHPVINFSDSAANCRVNTAETRMEQRIDMVDEVQFEIDLLGLLRHLFKKVEVILGVTILCAVLSFSFSRFVLPQEYVASSRVYVLNRTEDNTVTSSDLAMSNYLVNDLKVLITGRNVTEIVIDALELDMSNEELSSRIRVSAEENTRVLQISVTDSNAQLAADIANCVREAAMEQIISILDIDAVKLVYEAKAPEEPSSPNVLKNTVLASATGLLLSVSILSGGFYLTEASRSKENP